MYNHGSHPIFHIQGALGTVVPLWLPSPIGISGACGSACRVLLGSQLKAPYIAHLIHPIIGSLYGAPYIHQLTGKDRPRHLQRWVKLKHVKGFWGYWNKSHTIEVAWSPEYYKHYVGLSDFNSWSRKKHMYDGINWSKTRIKFCIVVLASSYPQSSLYKYNLIVSS